MQFIRRIIAGATAAAMAATALLCLTAPVTAAEKGLLYVETQEASPGDNVDISILLDSNPGITAISFQVEYDPEVLTLTGAEDTGLLAGADATFGNDLTQVPYTLCWDDLTDHKQAGTLAVLHFTAANDAPEGFSPVTLTLNSGSTFNSSFEEVPVDIVSGGVDIRIPAVSTAPEETTAQTTAAETVATVPETVPATEAASTITEETPVTAGLLSVDSASGAPGDLIEIPVRLAENPGIAALCFEVSYDTKQLALVQASDAGLLPALSATFGGDTTAMPYRLCWDSLGKENAAGTGLLAVLTFRIRKDAAPAAASPVTLTVQQSSTFDKDLHDVIFAVQNGSVEILPPAESTTTVTDVPAETGTETVPPEETTAETETTLPVETETSGVILADEVTAAPGRNVTVPLRIQDNPGINSLILRITYDPAYLTYQDVSPGSVFPPDALTVKKQAGQVVLWWNDTVTASDITASGVLAELKLAVAPETPEPLDLTLTLEVDAAYSIGMESVPLTARNGTIQVRDSGEPVFLLGDLNDDGVVNASDAALILIAAARIGGGGDSGLTEAQQLAANVNGDADINASDAALVLIYAAAFGGGTTDAPLEDFLKTRQTSPAPAPKRAVRRSRNGVRCG